MIYISFVSLIWWCIVPNFAFQFLIWGNISFIFFPFSWLLISWGWLFFCEVRLGIAVRNSAGKFYELQLQSQIYNHNQIQELVNT